MKSGFPLWLHMLHCGKLSGHLIAEHFRCVEQQTMSCLGFAQSLLTSVRTLNTWTSTVTACWGVKNDDERQQCQGPLFCALGHIQVMRSDHQANGQANKSSTQGQSQEERGPRHSHTAKSGDRSQHISSKVIASIINVRVLTLWLTTT